MSGFNNSVLGGQSDLVRVAIKSPNFVHGVSGWSIDKNGDAEFQDVIIPGTGGAVVTFASTAPASPDVGDLWYDTAAGLLLSQWNGSAWVPYQIGTGAISTGAITGTLLAPSVTARSIGGITTTIASSAPAGALAGDMWIDSAAGYQLQQYSGSAWVPVTFTATNVLSAASITAAQIAAGTITAAQIAAGIVLAGVIDGTTVNAATFTGSVFEGTDFIINSSGAFYYASTPAAGNLTESNARASGTDASGNNYVAGHATYESGFATSVNGGYITFYTGSLSAGWAMQGQLEVTTAKLISNFTTTEIAGELLVDGVLNAVNGIQVYPGNITIDMGVPTGYPYSTITVAVPGSVAAWGANVDGVVNALVNGFNSLVAEMISRDLIS